MKMPVSWADTPRNRFLWWMQSQVARNSKEWAEWDGTYADGERINDMQCARMDEAKAMHGWPKGLMCVCNGARCECA